MLRTKTTVAQNEVPLFIIECVDYILWQLFIIECVDYILWQLFIIECVDYILWQLFIIECVDYILWQLFIIECVDYILWQLFIIECVDYILWQLFIIECVDYILWQLFFYFYFDYMYYTMHTQQLAQYTLLHLQMTPVAYQNTDTMTSEELEKYYQKLTKRHNAMSSEIVKCNSALRTLPLGQDR